MTSQEEVFEQITDLLRTIFDEPSERTLNMTIKKLFNDGLDLYIDKIKDEFSF